MARILHPVHLQCHCQKLRSLQKTILLGTRNALEEELGIKKNNNNNQLGALKKYVLHFNLGEVAGS